LEEEKLRMMLLLQEEKLRMKLFLEEEKLRLKTQYDFDNDAEIIEILEQNFGRSDYRIFWKKFSNIHGVNFSNMEIWYATSQSHYKA
jgi:hypothetical protein